MTVGDGGEEVLDFRRELNRLKQEGCALLVVGELPHEAHRSYCRQALDRETASRWVILETGVGCTIFRDRVDESHTTRIVYEPVARSASAAPSDPDARATFSEVASIQEAGQELRRAIAEEGTAVSRPGQLRACIDSLLPLVDDYGRERVFRFLHPVARTIRTEDGMLHAHLPVERETEVARVFERVADAVIELRVSSGLLQQQWHLSDPDITTEWLQVTHV